jgi:hypothetical protein
MRFDQYVHRDRPFEAGGCGGALHGSQLASDVVAVARLGQRQEGQATPGTCDDDLDILLPAGVGDVVDAGADAAKAVGARS